MTLKLAAPRRKLLLLLAGNPARLIVSVWLTYLLVWWLIPFVYPYPIRFLTWVFVSACVLGFALMSVLGRMPVLPTRRPTNQRGTGAARLNRLVQVTAVIGLLGGLSIFIDRIAFSGIDYSAGLTAARLERQLQTSSGGGFFNLLGLATFSFSVVSFQLYLLRAEELTDRSRQLALLSLAAPVAFAVLYGGRSPLLILLALALGACLVRLATGKATLLPLKGRGILMVGALAIALYSGYIFVERMRYVEIEDVASFATRYESQEVRPARWLEDVMATEVVGPPVLIVGLLSANYVTDSLSNLDRLLTQASPLGPYYLYRQAGAIGVALDRLLPSISLHERMLSDLDAARLDGVFLTAPGGMYLDFGLWGALAALAALGWAAGVIHRRATRKASTMAQLLLCYLYAAILLSPVESMLGMSNGSLILLSILVCGVLPGIAKAAAPRR